MSTSKLTRQQATQLCAANVASIFGANDAIDVRKQKVNFQAYSCRIIGDSCVFIIANNLEECKQYIKKCMGGIEWTQADTNDWPAPYTRMTCYAGLHFGQTTSKVVLYKFDNKTQYGNITDIKEYMKALI